MPDRPLPTAIDGPVAAIGDVHGHAGPLRALLARLRALPGSEDRWIVFLGDFADRGPDSRGVFDAVLALRREHPLVTAVAGNHDLALAGALGLFRSPPACNWAERYLRFYDAGPTFASYGVRASDVPALAAAMPESHKRLLAGLPWRVEHPRYLFVHAGLQPDVAYADQLARLRSPDFTDGRPPWLCEKALADAAVPADCPVTVVSGHVRVPEVAYRDRRVLCDTSGGAAGGRLSAVLLPENEVINVPCDPSESWDL